MNRTSLFLSTSGDDEAALDDTDDFGDVSLPVGEAPEGRTASSLASLLEEASHSVELSDSMKFFAFTYWVYGFLRQLIVHEAAKIAEKGRENAVISAFLG